MIIVDCSEVIPIKHSLMIFVADQVEALPSSKQTEFVLTPIDGHHELYDWQVVCAIESYLKKIGENKNFEVTSKSSKVFIKSKNGRKITGDPPNVPEVKQWHYTWERRYS